MEKRISMLPHKPHATCAPHYLHLHLHLHDFLGWLAGRGGTKCMVWHVLDALAVVFILFRETTRHAAD